MTSSTTTRDCLDFAFLGHINSLLVPMIYILPVYSNHFEFLYQPSARATLKARMFPLSKQVNMGVIARLKLPEYLKSDLLDHLGPCPV